MPMPKPEEEVIFTVARRLEPGDARAHYIERACGSDHALSQRIEALLRVDIQDETFLKSPAAELRAALDDARDERPGSVVGPYKLLEQIGEGGFGVVFMAEEPPPQRRAVALKIIKPGMDTPQVVARFEAERRALALMEHPHIARVFDGGLLASGRPYFVMELVRGIPITEACDRDRLPLRERLKLMVDVCDAVQHAHQKGVIHRDLKPSNVLVTRHDGAAVVKVIDFGIAKAIGGPLTDRTLLTRFAQFVGTPLYMSPEQMELSGLDIDTRADIYALGVLLYELLTGATPFDRERFRTATFDEIRRIVREEEPARPSLRVSAVKDDRSTDSKRMSRLLRGELDWIVMKCLEKDRNRRYASASDLGRDLQRYLNDETVEARPPSAGYRLRKFLHRNRQLAVAGSLMLLVLLAGVIGTTTGMVRAQEARQAEAERAEAEARERRRAEIAEADARRNEADAIDKLAFANALTDFLKYDLLGQASSIAQADRKHEPRPMLSVREALDRAATGVGDKFKDRPLLEASIRFTIGSAYRDIGEPVKAIVQLRQAAAISERLRGGIHSDTMLARHQLAGALLDAGEFAESVTLYEMLRDQRLATLPADHELTLNTLNSLAVAYRSAGKRKQSREILQQVYDARTRVLGSTHRRTLLTLDSLAVATIEAGEAAAAIPMLEKVHEGLGELSGPEHYDTLLTLANLGVALLEAHQPAKAEVVFKKVRDAAMKTLGPGNVVTMNAGSSLAAALAASGHLDDAIALGEEIDVIRTKQSGPEHPDTLKERSNLAALYRRDRQLDRAIALLEATLKSQRKILDAAHPHLLHTIASLGVCYLDADRLNDALPLLEDVHRKGGRLKPLQLSGERLMQVYINTGKRAEGIALLNDWLAWDRESLAPESLPLSGRLIRFGFILTQLKAWPEAEKVLRESLAIRTAAEPEAWTTFNTQSLLGEALLGQKKYAAAEPLLMQGYAGMKEQQARIPPEARARFVEALQRLVKLYEAWDKPEDAAKWQAELDRVRPRIKK